MKKNLILFSLLVCAMAHAINADGIKKLPTLNEQLQALTNTDDQVATIKQALLTRLEQEKRGEPFNPDDTPLSQEFIPNLLEATAQVFKENPEYRTRIFIQTILNSCESGDTTLLEKIMEQNNVSAENLNATTKILLNQQRYFPAENIAASIKILLRYAFLEPLLNAKNRLKEYFNL